VKINPMKRVPAIVDTDNGLELVESHSILKYLAQKFKVPEHWYPREDLAKQAKINEFLDFHHSSTRKCSYLCFHLLFAPILKTGDPTFNEAYTEKVVKAALRNFQAIYLKDTKFIGGEKPSIGDLIAFYDITMLELLDFDYSPYPKIIAWVAEMRKIDGVQKADEKFLENKQRIKKLRQKNAAKAKL
jgi:glutathione S-transferase